MTSLRQATGITLAAYVIAAVLDYAFVLAMSWLLPSDQYGMLSVVMTWFLLLSFFVASGFPMSLAKFLAESPHARPGLVRYALLGNLLVATVVVALFLGLTFYGPLSPGPGYGRLVFLVAAAVLLLSVGGTLQFALQGRMRFASFAVLHASKSANKLVIGVALVMVGSGVLGAGLGLLLGGLVLVAGSMVALHAGGERPLARSDLSREEKRRYLRYTLVIFVGSFALTLLMSLDLLAVKYLTPDATSNALAGSYQAATVVTKAPLWGVLAALSVVFPLLSRASQGAPREASRLLRRVLRWMTLALAPMTIVLLVFPERVLGIAFPERFASMAPTLAVSALGMAALATCLVLTRALQATGRARAPGAYLSVSVALQAALLFALVPRYGALGAAWATTIACLAGAGLALGAATHPFRLRVRVRDAAALATSLMLLVAIVWAMAPHGRVATLGSFATGGAAYAVAISALGLVERSELRAIVRALPLVGRLVQATSTTGAPAEADA